MHGISGVVTKPIWGDERDTLIQEICLIDYARTRKGSLMADLAKLETEIKFHLLVLERGIDWQLLLGFEEAVSRELALRSIAARDAPRDNAELQKAFSAIAMIRDVALKLLARHPDLDPASYWAQLYVNTLQTLTHRDSTIGQHRYAAVSAAMIMERQLSE